MLQLPRDILDELLSLCDGASQLTLRETCKSWLAIAERRAEKGFDGTADIRGINYLAYVHGLKSIDSHSLPGRELYRIALRDVAITCEKLRLAELIIDTLPGISGMFTRDRAYPTQFWAGLTRMLMLRNYPVEEYMTLALAAYMDDIDLVKRLMNSQLPTDISIDSPCRNLRDPLYYEHGYLILKFAVKHEYLDIFRYTVMHRFRRMTSEACAEIEDINPVVWKRILWNWSTIRFSIGIEQGLR